VPGKKPAPPAPPPPEAEPTKRRLFSARNIAATAGICVCIPVGFAIALEQNHNFREDVQRQYPDVITKVREWYDIGKLDCEKTVWELEAEKGPWQQAEPEEIIMSQHGVEKRLCVESMASASSVLSQLRQASGADLQTMSMQDVTFRDM